jgi:hypothetical protein
MKIKLMGILTLSLLIMVSIFQSCTISLSGATLDPELKTFYIPNFTNNAENALPSLSQRLTEDLKDKVRAESRLVLSEEEPDIEFRGTLVDYRITAEAPRTGESTAINRLTITLAISYFNNRKNTEIWQKNFSFFYDFSSAIDFSSVQEAANKAISKQIMEDIFNAAFSNW